MSLSKLEVFITIVTGPDSKKFRLWLYLGAWIAAYFIISPFAIFAVHLLPFFPLGLFRNTPGNDAVSFMVLGWFVYIIYGIFHFLNPSRVLFYVFYVMFLIALIFNAVGCHKTIEGLSSIH